MKISSKIIQQTAQHCGFALCGIAKSHPLTIPIEYFKKAIALNLHANKEYLERDIEKRFNPILLLDNCKSVIVCGFNYNTRYAVHGRRCAVGSMRCEISQYAKIKDYHVFMKEKLKKMTRILQEKYGYFNYIITVDSSAISEKAWAVQTGIGYYGKNGIIQTSLGSFVFLGTVLIDIEVDKYDEPIKNSCNNCVKCMIACPTQAIVAPFCVDSNRCISNINLNKNESDFKNIAKYGWLVGCDICQNVCPNNAHAPVNKETIALRAPFMKNQNQILETLTPESFEHYFKNTTIYKFKYEGLMRRVEAMNSFVL